MSYTKNDRLNDILDKISNHGIDSISDLEKEFLDAHSIGNEDDIHEKLNKEESKICYKDKLFKFEYIETEHYINEVHYIGILHTPDLILSDNTKIDGTLTGKLIVLNSGETIVNFYTLDDDENIYDVFDFCDGLEEELDSFIDYVIENLEENDSL